MFSKSTDNKINIDESQQYWKFHYLAYDDQISHDPVKFIFNYLPVDEKRLLTLGLNFALPTAKLNYPSFLAPFEQLYRNIKHLPSYKCNSNKFKTFIKNTAYSSYHNYEFTEAFNLLEKDHSILKELSHNDNIVIQKIDKGNAIVVLNKSYYNKGMMSILNGTSKLNKVNIPKNRDILNLILVQGKTSVKTTKVF